MSFTNNEFIKLIDNNYYNFTDGFGVVKYENEKFIYYN
jgi:hypothetical protein